MHLIPFPKAPPLIFTSSSSSPELFLQEAHIGDTEWDLWDLSVVENEQSPCEHTGHQSNPLKRQQVFSFRFS